ncbi:MULTISPECIES: FMN-binding protein [Blautia]|jgi:uncharacterized protein with FMN-binding domain|uniref:FMN-binding protein n=1 Tax=Blautia TaxID=572511 RepID=UPI00137179B5|nr:FMN-binding protein [Blautia sp. BIOML-A1]MZT66109.1 FMN-binding protein [Blautia sp. BIOML-A1]
MKYHSFYMRLLCLILIIGAVLGYNFMQKNDTQALQITELTDRVSALEEQQKEMLTALEDAAKAQEEARAAAYNASQKTETDNETGSSDAAASGEGVYKDGTYTGEAQGFGGTIQVQVTLSGDEITDIQVTSAPGEDAAYLSQGEGVISSIISAQSTDVDTVSGATFSSTGIINAVVDALGKAENA